jgi:hypothetical protein
MLPLGYPVLAQTLNDPCGFMKKFLENMLPLKSNVAIEYMQDKRNLLTVHLSFARLLLT